MKSFSVRNIVISAFILLLILCVGYKYYEWTTLQKLSTFYNQTWTQEFGLVQDENKNIQPYLDLREKIYDKNTKNTLVNSYDEYVGSLRLIISSQESYLDTIKQNNNAYSEINTFFLFGERGNFAKNLVSSQKQYYKYEINDAEISDAYNWLNYNITTVLRDYEILQSFGNNITSNTATNISKYFQDLYPVEKYIRTDFKFEHEDDIKIYYPNGYDALTKYKNYFSNYYSVIQDIVNGYNDSATYKLSTAKEAGTNLNISFADFYNQNNETTIKNAKNIIQIISNEANSIKDFKTKKLFKYPLLSNIGSWKEDLVLCQMYNFKSGLYHGISTNHIKAKDATSLLSELSIISPSTKFVDGKFDKSVLKIVNDDKKIQFTCLDKNSNTTYQFITLK